jgi:hypothetical protein
MDKCKWVEADPDFDDSMWETSCGEAFTFINGGPTENGVLFCHHCGKPVEVVSFDPKLKDEDDEEEDSQ